MNDEQLSNLKIRKFDKTIIHTGKFVFDDNNVIETGQDRNITDEINENKIQYIVNILKNIPNSNRKYLKELLISFIAAIIIIPFRMFILTFVLFYLITVFMNLYK